LSETTDADSNSTSGSVEVQDAAGNWITVNFTEIENMTLPAINASNNYIVEGTAGADDIGLSYVGDPQGDLIDNNDHSDGSNDDSVIAGAGNDTVRSGDGQDTVLAGDGDDQVFGQAGDDILSGDAGNDSLDGDAGADSIDGGTGSDTLIGDAGDDTLIGGADNDEIYGGTDNDVISGDAGDDLVFAGDGDDSITGGSGVDTLVGNDGDDTLDGGTGDDSLDGSDGDDTFVLNDGFGNDTIIGGETAETNGDTLDLSNLTTGVTVDLTDANAETGTVSDGTDTANFVEIENIVLGAGRDTVVLADGSGDDTVQAFDMTDSGDGTTMDQLDVSALTTATGDPVTTDDVVITDTNGDGSGNAILTFPNGESITLIGVGASQVDTSEELLSIGIPPTLNYIVEGTAAGEVINPGYVNDPQDDKVDENDALDGSNDDNIMAFGGDDTVGAGLGDDTVDAGDGNDEVYGESGNDSLIGGLGDDTMLGETGNDTLSGGAGADSLDGGDGADSLTGGAGSDTLWGQDGNDTLDGGDNADFVNGGEGDDLITGGDGNDTLEGWFGNDTIDGGAGNDYIDADNDSDYVDAGSGDDTVVGGFSVSTDTIISGAGNDSIDGQAGDDLLYGGTGADEQFGSQGDDTFFLEDDFGADTIEGGELDEVNGDTLDLSAVTQDTTVDLRSADPEAGSVSNGTDTASFTEIENIVLGAGRDTLVLGDGSGDDTVQAFDMTDSGDGTTMDQLDVTDLTDAGGAPVDTGDVVVTDTNGDGTGDAILTFPNGESITLDGVDPASLATPAQLESIGIPAAGAGPDFVVSGTAAGELIDGAYLGDPEGDLVDNNDHSDGSNVDMIEAGGGDDTVYAGADNDTVYGQDGDDSLFGEAGDDTLYGEAGADTLSGGSGDDLLFGGDDADSLMGDAGNDTLNDGTGDDFADGGADADTFITQDGYGNDTLVGGETGTDDDTLQSLKTGDVTLDLTAGGTAADPESGTLISGADTVTFSEIENIELGAGDDSVIGSDGDDNVETGAGSDTVDGGAGNDSFDLGALDGVSDTVVLSDGDGDDTVTSFELPTDNGDGTFTGNDLLDVTDLTDASGDPVNINDVLVTNDGSGNAVIEFPNGESVTLVGVTPGDLADPLVLQAMGIPGTTPDFIVDGTAADDLIIDTYADDPEGDMIDNNDAADGSNDDVVFGYGGDDVIEAGDGNDTLVGGIGDDQLFGEDGNDSLEGGADNDSLFGGLGDDTMLGGDGDDSLFGSTGADSIEGGAGDDTIRFTDDDTVDGGDGDDLFTADALVLDGSPITITGGENAETGGDTLSSGSYNSDVTVDLTAGGTGADPESGTMQLGSTTVTFTEVENIQTGAGDDTITGSAGDDNVTTGDGADVVNAGDGDDNVTGGAGADTLTGGDGADTLFGGDDDDVLNVGSGDSAFGDDGDDVFNLTPGDLDGTNLTITGGEGGETLGDTLNITGPAAIVYDDPSEESGTITYYDTGEVVTFSEIENINYIPCFTPGTLIKTAQGEMPVEEITVGTRVLTNDHGYQPVVWAGAREIDAETLAQNYALKPVLIRKGALGKNMPERDMMVSPQHRMLIGNFKTALWLGEEEVLVPAKFLVGLDGIEEVQSGGVTYIHFMFNDHQVVMSDGCWSESFQPGDTSMGALTEDAREEILTLFPELADQRSDKVYPAARPTVDAKQARVLFHS
jgi:Ca2+-binding RTX toxin-like protein